MRIFKLAAFLVPVMLLIPAAAASDPLNTIRADIYYTSPQGDETFSIQSVTATLNPLSTWGGQIAYERKFSSLIGVNILAGYEKYDIQLSGGGTENQFATEKAFPVSLNLLLHPIQGRNIDLYIGGGLSVVTYLDADLAAWVDEIYESSGGEGLPEINGTTNLGYGLEAGIDLMMSDRIGVNFDVQYMKTSFHDLQIDPLKIGAGIAIHF